MDAVIERKDALSQFLLSMSVLSGQRAYCIRSTAREKGGRFPIDGRLFVDKSLEKSSRMDY